MASVPDEGEGSAPDKRTRLPPSRAHASEAEEEEEEEEEEDAGEVEPEDEEEDDDDDDEDDAAMTWPEWFCSLAGNEFFAEVEEEFLLDEFNLTGLASAVPHYNHALDLILDTEPEEPLAEEEEELVSAAAELLYGLVHARFVLTAKGQAAMAEKFENGHFGRCPRALCARQKCVPAGISDQPRLHTVKLYCPRCRDLYHPRHVRHASVDGAFFGTTFPHLLFQSHPELLPPPPSTFYVPRIYGFKVHRPPGQQKPVHERLP